MLLQPSIPLPPPPPRRQSLFSPCHPSVSPLNRGASSSFLLACHTSQVGLYTVKMSRRNGPKLELKLNLSPPRMNPRVESPSRSATVSPTSPPSSCVSSEMNLQYSSSPEATSMVLVGCPSCLMYFMLSEDDPKCPKCKSTVLLDFLHDANTNTTTPDATYNTRKS